MALATLQEVSPGTEHDPTSLQHLQGTVLVAQNHSSWDISTSKEGYCSIPMNTSFRPLPITLCWRLKAPQRGTLALLSILPATQNTKGKPERLKQKGKSIPRRKVLGLNAFCSIAGEKQVSEEAGGQRAEQLCAHCDPVSPWHTHNT